jgi:hypothetical protein
VPVAFVVAEEKVLAMGGIDLFPVFQCKFDSRERGMMVCLEFNAV